jgi:hypothetical protein
MSDNEQIQSQLFHVGRDFSTSFRFYGSISSQSEKSGRGPGSAISLSFKGLNRLRKMPGFDLNIPKSIPQGLKPLLI